MDKESEAAVGAGAAPLEQVRESVQSDLQYVSIQLDGGTYGGWYRLLPDGRMELLALANMHCERRCENTPAEQAQGMLADFVRRSRNKQPDDSSGTLGDLLYVDKSKTRVSEQDWAGLIECIAAGDPLALRQLYERAHRVVFTLLVRLTRDREAAEQLTLNIFHDIRWRASEYDAACGSVLGWILNHARSRAIAHRQRDSLTERADEPASQREAPGYWPTEVLCPQAPLWERLAQRLALTAAPMAPASGRWMEPEWEAVAPGITCKLLATDMERDSVTMLVRLAPGTDYPPHRHAGTEELHLLDGELWIDQRKLYPGGYNRAEPGTADARVWSETGCMCVLITSTRDAIG